MEPCLRPHFDLVVLRAAGLQLGTLPLGSDVAQGKFLEDRVPFTYW